MLYCAIASFSCCFVDEKCERSMLDFSRKITRRMRKEEGKELSTKA
jgi:hypothetical protein